MRTSSLKSSTLIVALIGALALSAFSSGHATAFSRTAVHQAPRQGGTSGKQFHGGHFNSTSTNWSGYASNGSTYTDVKGTWVQPTANCSSGSTAYSSFWVGIDGDGTNSVEQLGTDSDCSGSSPRYYGWWEMYPNPSHDLSTSTYSVRPGDTLTAEVHSSGSTFTLTLHSSRGWTFSTNQSSSSAQFGSAEWIAEAPSSSSGVLPLANFGTVNFSSCTANGNAISANPNVDAITMKTSGGTVKAQPSGLNGSGNGFSVTWHHR
jgi:hypothetical protein